MKLDSEEQREQLLNLLGQVVLQVKLVDADSLAPQINDILDPIRHAEIEQPAESGDTEGLRSI